MEKIIHFVVLDTHNHEAKKYIDAARSLHPGWEIKVWDSHPGGDEFYLKDHYKMASSPAVMMHMMALDIVHCYGGVFLDCNICLVKSLDFLITLDHFFISEHGQLVSTAFFGANKANPVIRFLLEEVIKKTSQSAFLSEKASGSEFFSRKLRWYPDLIMLPASLLVAGSVRLDESSLSLMTVGVYKQKRMEKPGQHKGSPGVSFPRRLGFAGIVNAIKNIFKRVFERFYNYAFHIGKKKVRMHYPFGQDIITKTNRGLNMSLPGNDLSIVPAVVFDGKYEENELNFVENILGGGDFFVDVGCNIGIYTLVAARKVGPFGRVFAFDPNPIVITHLKRSLFMNYLHDRVKVYNVALGDNKEPTTIHFSDNCLGDASMGLDERSFHAKALQMLGNATSIEVPQTTLDEVIHPGIDIKFMKVDVEGFEHKVIAGAKRLLTSRAIHYIMLELIDDIDFNEHHKNLEAIDFIRSCGYSLHKLLANGRLEPIADISQRMNDGNFILIKS